MAAEIACRGSAAEFTGLSSLPKEFMPCIWESMINF
jgi:hypothetical protein